MLLLRSVLTRNRVECDHDKLSRAPIGRIDRSHAGRTLYRQAAGSSGQRLADVLSVETTAGAAAGVHRPSSFVLLLVVGEATQQALLGEDFSLTMAVTVIATLIGLDCFADYIGYRFPKVDRVLESVSVLLVDDGKLMKDRMAKAHIDEEEILTFARQAHGLESMDQVKYAVLEKDGGITVVPVDENSSPSR